MHIVLIGQNKLRGTLSVHDDIKTALLEYDYKVTTIHADNQLLSRLEKIDKPHLIINLSTGLSDKRSQANIVGLLEMTGIPILGSGLISHVVGLHKEMTKSLLNAHNIRNARFQLIEDENVPIRPDFVYPLIVKPEHEGSGVGLTASSLVEIPKQLKQVIREKISEHNQVLLVEEFLPGREFTVGVIGNKELEILPIKETIFPEDGLQILTDAMKTEDLSISEIPANIPTVLEREIIDMTEKTYRILRCQDFSRIDFRLDRNGQPNVIEINTAPGLKDNFSFFPLIAKAAGYNYSEFIHRLVQVALEPRGLQ